MVSIRLPGSSMRILLLSQFFPPEMGAPQNRLSYLTRHLAASGHTVTVLTAMPNYPTGRIFRDYRGRLIAEERENGARIIRTWLYATKSRAFLARILCYCSFSMMSLLACLWKAGEQDVVIVESPPLPLGLTGFLIGKLKGARLVLNISDLWPESAVALGYLNNRRAIRFATWLEEFLYANADLITGQTQGIIDSIQLRCPEKPVKLIPNGVDLDLFVRSSGGELMERDDLRSDFGLEGKFVVGYAGLMGLAQDLDTVLQSAQMLTAFPEIVFVLVGEGPELSRLKSEVQSRNLGNVQFVPIQPANRMPRLLASFDAALVPLKRLPLFRAARPSKMFEAMGAGIPIICSVDGEARRIVEDSAGGIYVEPQDASQMANAVLSLYLNPSKKASLGENGRRYVSMHFDRRVAAEEFENLLIANSYRASQIHAGVAK